MQPKTINLSANKKLLLLEILASLIILLFAYASLYKVFNFSDFVKEMDNQPLPKSWTPFLVHAIPVLEIGATLLLSFRISRFWGFLLSSVIMIFFTAYTVTILLHGFSYIPCACGGMIEHLNWDEHLLLNSIFLVFSLLGVWLSQRKTGTHKSLPQRH